MDAGLIDLLLNTMTGQIRDGVTTLVPLAYLLLALSLLAALVATLWVVIFDQPMVIIFKICLWFITAAAILIPLIGWSWWTNVLADSFVAAGLGAAGNEISVDEFMSPGRLAAKGSAITNPIQVMLSKMGYAALWQPFEATTMILLAAGLGVIWVLIALNALTFIFLFQLFCLVGFIGLPFLVWPSLRWFGFGLVRLVISGGLALFALAAWTSIMNLVIPELVAGAINSKGLDLWAITILFAVSLFFLCMSTAVPILSGIGGFVGAGSGMAKLAGGWLGTGASHAGENPAARPKAA